MTRLRTVPGHTHLAPRDGGWLTGVVEIQTNRGGLAVDHGRIAQRDGTLVAESCQARLTTTD